MSTPVTAPYTFLNVTASTTAAKKQLVAAVTGQRHRIIGMTVTSAAAQIVTLQSSTGLAMMGPVNVGATDPMTWPSNFIGYCETAASRSIMNQSENATATLFNLIYQTYTAT